MKLNFLFPAMALLLFCQAIKAQNQNIGIGTSTPHASALVDIASISKGVLLPRMTYTQRTQIASPATGLLVYQTDTYADPFSPRGFYVYDVNAWKQVFQAADVESLTGWHTGGPNLVYTNRSVGIGTPFPGRLLTVAGSMNAQSGEFTSLLAGTPVAGYPAGLRINEADMLLNDGYIQINANTVEKGFIQLAGDNLRLGTNSTNTNGKVVLRTFGADRVTVDANGDMAVTGDITRGGKGVLYNAANANNLRYHSFNAGWSIVLAGDAVSGELTIGYSGFTTPPDVMVGEIVSTGGTVGQLFKLQLVIYDVTATQCKARIVNNSPSAINQSITWKIICVGN